jgi:hypothetical protein
VLGRCWVARRVCDAHEEKYGEVMQRMCKDTCAAMDENDIYHGRIVRVDTYDGSHCCRGRAAIIENPKRDCD